MRTVRKLDLFCVTLLITMSWGCATARPAPAVVEQHERVTLSDGEFAHLMATHHRIVKDIALVESSKGKSPELKDFAAKIWEARHRDLPAWDEFEKLIPKLSDLAAIHEREMIATHRATLERLKAAKSAALDKLFVEEMLRLNQFAFNMIDPAQLDDPGVKQLAERFAETQRAELKQLKALSGDLASGR